MILMLTFWAVKVIQHYRRNLSKAENASIILLVQLP